MSNLQQWSLAISDALAVFRLHRQSRRYRPSTLDFYDKRLRPFADWLAAQQVNGLRGISANHIRAYIVQRQDADAAAHYVHSIARALRTFFKFCVAEEWLPASPMCNVAMPRLPKHILPAFTPDDIKALVKAAQSEREKAILLFLLDTGCALRSLLRCAARTSN
jgi:integrase/recombinase XerD